MEHQKSPDKSGLAAEHLKCYRPVIIDSVINLFNQILQEKSVPGPLKAGILIPVLKKLKDFSKLDNYHGITVTPIIGKLFETVLLPRITLSTLSYNSVLQKVYRW